MKEFLFMEEKNRAGNVDELWEPDEPATAELKIKRSLFIGHLGLCKNNENVRAFLEQAEAKYRNATHNCWAYCLSNGTEHCSDDGEPSGTAGKPILHAIKQSGMVNLMIVVTRYYGGVKLGVRGLIDAYGQAAGEVISKTIRVLRVRSKQLKIHLPYNTTGDIIRLLEIYGTPDAPAWEYGAEAEVCAEIKLSAAPQAAAALQELQAKSLIFSWDWVEQ